MVYTKLITRGVLRYNKKNRRIYILLTLCTAAIIFALSFNESFYNDYVDLGIDTKTAHLQVVSADSNLLKAFWESQKEELPLIKIDADFERFVNGLKEVQKSSRLIETEGVFYTLEGEMQNEYDLTGINPKDFKQILPGIKLVKGKSDFTYIQGMKDVPFLRWNIQSWEIVKNNDVFRKENFRLTGKDLDEFKNSFKKDFPTLLPRIDYSGETGTDDFISDLNKILSEPDLYKLIPESYLENYNYETDDIIAHLKTIAGNDLKERAKWNKRLFQSIYDKVITPVPEEVALDVPMTLMVPSAKSSGKIDLPKIIPLRFVGFVEGMPQYYTYNFIDITILQEYLELSKDECTSYLVRLNDKAMTNAVKQKIESYIETRGLDYKLIDYRTIGDKIHMPTATAFSYIISYLILLFIVIVVLFIINSVMFSIIKRRKEIGTAITLGMSKSENIFVFIGEMIVLVTASWILGSLLGSGLILLFAKIGVPGIVFVQGGKLFLSFKWKYPFLAYLILLPTVVFASLLPSFSIRRSKVVELLKGELSKKADSAIFFKGSGFLTLKLALRNIFSHKLRNLVICVVVAFVTMLLFLFLTFSDGEIANFRNGFLALLNPPSDIIVKKKGFWEAQERNEKTEDLLKMTIDNYLELRQRLTELDFVKNVYYSPRLVNLDLFVDGKKYKSMRFRGTDVNFDDSISSRITIGEGEMIKPGQKNVLLLNENKKQEFQTHIGQTVTIIGNDLFGQAVAEDFTLIGFFKPNIDNPNLANFGFVDMDGYKLISGYFNTEAGSLDIDLKKGASLDSAIVTLNRWALEKGIDVEFKDFNEINPYSDDVYAKVRNDIYAMVRIIIITICFIVILIVMFGIMNIISANLFDRKKEIGTYYCLGAEKPFLIWVYSLEIMFVNIFASLLGIGSGLGLRILLNSLKINTTNAGAQLVFGGSVFYLGFSWSTIFWLVTGIIIVTLLTALSTIGSSLKVPPIVAVREIDE